MTLFVIVASVVCALPAIADEGMWPFNQFPKDAVAEKHKLDVTPVPASRAQRHSENPVEPPPGPAAWTKRLLSFPDWFIAGCRAVRRRGGLGNIRAKIDGEEFFDLFFRQGAGEQTNPFEGFSAVNSRG